MGSSAGFGVLDGRRYVNLQTFRKNGEGVNTPIWFAGEPAKSPTVLYVYTIGNSGKVKRIRNNALVKLAPCDIRGRLLGGWMDARAEIVTGEEAARGMRLLNRKYVPWKQLLGFFAMFRPRERCVIVIRPA